MVKSACGIEAVYMCFNGTGIWGGETLTVCCRLPGPGPGSSLFPIWPLLGRSLL